MVYNFVGFWLCGVLLGAFLCFKAGMGVIGLWWGIASGDTVTGASMLLGGYLRQKLFVPSCKKGTHVVGSLVAPVSKLGILNVATLYCVNWPEESKKAQQTLSRDAEENQAIDQDNVEETDALIPGGRQHSRSSGKQEMVPV
eukprot:1158231-Pelagomonas_calceolata.AAC.11